MKIIFLDVDGVLNSIDSEDHLGAFIGVDYSGVKLLREIVDKTGAEIVLVSSWKHRWHKTKENQGVLANYLDKRLAEENLKIIDKTKDNITNRGEGIYNWLSVHPEVESWIILDDEIFEDYEQYGCMPYLVKTSFYDGGLKDKHVEQAIALLNKIE
jgi:orotate phosphoribosyltransferase-like protein